MYLGHLYTFADQQVYGYITNTKVKFVIIISNPNDAVLRTADIVQVRACLCSHLH